MLAFIPGLLVGFSLIMAIGAQNAFVIRQGLARQNVFLVVTICAIADATLIAAGISGLGAIISGLPWLLEGIRWFGVAYLTWFGIASLRSVFKTQRLESADEPASASAKKIVLATLGFTLLNPHVYLDTVILVGSVANQFADNRWIFGFGAMTASVIWFYGLGFGAKAASGLMNKPVFWKILDALIAVVMFSVAAFLAFAKL